MRPQLTLRARRASTALGAWCLTMTTVLGVLPDTARSQNSTGIQPVAKATTVADITPGQRRLNVVLGRRATITGRVRPALGGRLVRVQRWTRHGWLTLARTTTRGSGWFVARFRPRRTMSVRLRLHVDRSRQALGRLNVYRRAYASWYGPGLYGNTLSCGGRLGPGTLGVAHRTLPCGTRVTLRLGSRIVRVRVIDRGPFVGGREFDLTAATRQRLRFVGVGTVLVVT